MTTATASLPLEYVRDSQAKPTETITYNDTVVRHFIAASMAWGVVGMLLGIVIALQLAYWPANVHPILSFGRLRPLHTNAVIFAFVGNMLFAGVYHSTQRLLKQRMGLDVLSKFHFWGWQLIIVAAALTLPLGYTQGKEYAELEWPIDIAIAVVWVAFGVNFFITVARRNEKHLYVSLWFYISTIVTVAVLHIVNSIAIPVGFLKSYSVYAGAQDALVQWWYGHNAVAFFLTTPILGIMYYYVPKAAERPVYSYRLSIVHFWALVFMYIWAGPHHLLHTALPEWAQSAGMLFSLMLWAPSWGGMLNGFFTIRQNWAKLREDPVLKFFAAALTFYGMATFEGPLLSIRSVSALAHYTDWIVGHVHSGALGWNGFMAFAVFYWLVPRLYGRELYSKNLANAHFWLGTMGVVFYYLALVVAGIIQGLMWREVNPDGSLHYTNFIETVNAIMPAYWFRLLGGTMYFVGVLIGSYNLWRTARGGAPVTTSIEVYVAAKEPASAPSLMSIFFSPPVVVPAVVVLLIVAMAATNIFAGTFFLFAAGGVGVLGGIVVTRNVGKGGTWHRVLESRSVAFTVLVVVAVLAGGVAEIIPSLIIKPAEVLKSDVRPYTPLELEGRDVYLREGCYTCHSQMIRSLATEAQRYGAASTAGESMYDHPFQWGSKRNGPDLAREGGKYPNLWHYKHMLDPRSITDGSIMPNYAHLASEPVDTTATVHKVTAMKSVGVPYTIQDIDSVAASLDAQAQEITKDLASQGIQARSDTQIIAIIAYLQRLGLHKSSFAGASSVTATKEK
jgi:cytochrome c oxidase cbb3-type subunit I/II